MLEIRNVQKSFGRKRVLSGLSLDIQDGELFTLLGASGCGKTTLLRIIAGLETAETGSLRNGGVDWFDAAGRRFVPPQKRNIGFVFQSYAIWPHLNVFGQVAYPLRNRRLPAQTIKSRVAAALDLVGLAGFEERHATELSGGQQQRVAVARAIVGEPTLLLLDEPFSNLDVGLRDQLRQELRDLQRKLGLTIILVTHDQADAFILSDRIAVMREGSIEQVASPEAIYGSPATDFVRRFVGRANNVRVEIRGAGRELVLPGGQRRTVVDGSLSDGFAWAWIRPEDIAIEDPARSGTADFRGTIASRSFLGDRYQCRILLEDGQELQAYQMRDQHLPADGHVALRLLAQPTLSSLSS